MKIQKHIKLKFIVILLCSFSSTANERADWLTNHIDIMQQEMVCKEQEKINDVSPCNYFASNVLYKGWGINDFGSTDKHKLANEMLDYVNNSSDWVHLGNGDSQETLNKAQELANDGYPVYAISSGKPNGHVAIIIPGSLSPSGAWKLNVPNSASFRLNKPRDQNSTYIGKMLSYSWVAADKNKVNIFYRKMD